jgi:UPF0042 nucleotide-binding protein
MQASRLIVLTGLSGSGKSTALKALEDLGFFCVDNLPSALLASFLDYLSSESAQSNVVKPYALLLEFREREDFSSVLKAIEEWSKKGIKLELLFLDCQDEVLLRRFRETRRPHPLLLYHRELKTVLDGIKKEREIVSDAREASNKIIDTSALTPHELRSLVEQYVGGSSKIKVFLSSFGFKYGSPHDVDLLIDVRFLPNPHFDAELKPKTGQDQQVRDYVFSSGEADEFVTKYMTLLEYLIPRYSQEGKHYLTIGIGCTGGKHRSVAIGEALRVSLEELGLDVLLSHRDIEKR